MGIARAPMLGPRRAAAKHRTHTAWCNPAWPRSAPSCSAAQLTATTTVHHHYNPPRRAFGTKEDNASASRRPICALPPSASVLVTPVALLPKGSTQIRCAQPARAEIAEIGRRPWEHPELQPRLQTCIELKSLRSGGTALPQPCSRCAAMSLWRAQVRLRSPQASRCGYPHRRRRT